FPSVADWPTDARRLTAASGATPGGVLVAEGPGAETKAQPQPPAKPEGASAPGPVRTVQSGGTVLVEKPGEPTYAQRLIESMKFLEKAVDKPVKIDPSLLDGTLPNVRRAYLTSAGMIMAEGKDGKSTTLSLMDLSTDQALNIMSQVMRTFGAKGA
ncbi:MAG TPA: hypothetical protein VJR06_04880, partial [Nitrososphaerales archaeon]|nr:hypothetical protein [Nitrososphaerales archaeon]